MLKEIEQAHTQVQSDMEGYLIKHRMLGYAFTDCYSQLESLKQQLNQLKEQLTE